MEAALLISCSPKNFAVVTSTLANMEEVSGSLNQLSADLAELKDGRVFLRGRLSDQINVAGRKVSPETVERVLLAHPAVSAATTARRQA